MKSAGFNNSSSVRRAVRRLINLNIIFEYEGEYRFVNPFFQGLAASTDILTVCRAKYF